jgi:hypothetical protein
MERTCSIVEDGERCGKTARMRGWCSMHHQRFLRHGDPLIAGRRVITGSVEDRLWGRVDKTETCWLWTGHTAGEGYGVISVDGRDAYVHRLVHEWLVGPIPEGYEVDHLCRVRLCVRPEHLEAVTQQENHRRAMAYRRAKHAARTHCRHGHPWKTNAYFDRGRRRCRTCQRAAQRAWYYRQKGEEPA